MDRFLFGITLKDWGWFIGGLITMIGVIKGLMEYIKNNRIGRADFLEKLIVEFNSSKMFLAKRILDDFWIERDGSHEISDIDLVKLGSMEKKEKAELAALVKDLLRNHADKSVIGYGEQQARQSFDDLLDFFTKLDYYLSLKLISKQELTYFQYYFQRCAYKADGVVMFYAATYGYPSLFRLLYVLGIKPKNEKLFNENLAFNDDRQKQYYRKLKSGFLVR
jgi:hypothetical protein